MPEPGRERTWRYDVNWTGVFVLVAFLLGVLVGSL